jgi:hypothetical protein
VRLPPDAAVTSQHILIHQSFASYSHFMWSHLHYHHSFAIKVGLVLFLLTIMGLCTPSMKRNICPPLFRGIYNGFALKIQSVVHVFTGSLFCYVRCFFLFTVTYHDIAAFESTNQSIICSFYLQFVPIFCGRDTYVHYF